MIIILFSIEQYYILIRLNLKIQIDIFILREYDV